MNELTIAQSVIYAVSGFLLYCLGIAVGKMWSDYRHLNPKQPRHKQKNKQQEGPGFNPNNPMNYNSSPAPIGYIAGYSAEQVTDQYGNVWYVRK